MSALEGVLESRVRGVVMGFVREGLPFRAADVAEVLAREGAREEPRQVARALAELERDGFLAPFGYRRTLTKDRTSAGWVTSVRYGPGPPRAGTAREASGGRRLKRQTEALRTQLEATAQGLVRSGELLLAVEALIGRDSLGDFAAEELGMSRETARRLARVAGVFRHHPKRAVVALLRPSVAYKLVEPSFPSELREAILERGLTVEGRTVPLERIRVRDLARARTQFESRRKRIAKLMRQIAELERAGRGEQAESLRRELKRIGSASPTVIEEQQREAE